MITSYTDSILNHESRFTHHFDRLGFVLGVAFPLRDYPTAHPALLNADLLLDDGCPALKRRAVLPRPAVPRPARDHRPLDAREGGGLRLPASS